MNHRGPLPLRELHSTDETLAWRDPGGSWACLQPVYYYGWNHPVRVVVTCHLTQELRTFIFRREYSLARKNRTRRKKSTVEDVWKIPEKNKKNEVPEQLKSTESLMNKATKKKKELSISKQPSKFPIKKKKKKKRDTKKTVKMSCLCKAGLFFLRWITADPSPWGNFTPPTKH